MAAEEDFRANLRRDLIAAGGDPVLADEVVDLSIHAAKSAIETMKSVIRRGSCPGVQLGCHGIAPVVLASMANAMEKRFDSVAVMFGLSTEKVTIGGAE